MLEYIYRVLIKKRPLIIVLLLI